MLKTKVENFFFKFLIQYYSTTYKIVYDQKDSKDLSLLYKLCECFNLFFSPSQSPKGLYMDSILR